MSMKTDKIFTAAFRKFCYYLYKGEGVKMGIGSIISLLGGLGAFLFGMSFMGDGLQLAAGSKMKDLLEKLTRHPVMGFLVGMLVTVCIQSSSATTVMAMGFINAGIMDLAQATGVIFGANIGTTITSILIALDVSGIAPVCIAAGAFLMLYSKKKRQKYIGQVILGFGLLFQGLHTMSSSMAPLKDSVVFQNFILNAKNPILGFVIGIVLCAVIQSSSAAVGILQALAMQGLMPLYFAAFIVCGINVGSSMPVILSALKAKNNAKRAAIIYLIFNCFGALLFIPLVMLTPLTQTIVANVKSAAFQVSFFHIMFKLVTGVILLMLTKYIVQITYRILPKQAHESAFRFEYIDEHLAGDPSVMALQVAKEIGRTANLVRDNVSHAAEALMTGNVKKAHDINDNEEVIDYLTGAIIDFVTKVSGGEMPEKVSNYLGSVFQIMNELEQIGDHAVKILNNAEKTAETKQSFSEDAINEFNIIYTEDLRLLDRAIRHYVERVPDDGLLAEARGAEKAIGRMSSEAQANHVKRMQDGVCTSELGFTFVESVNSLTRIANHIESIAELGVEAI